MRERYQAKFRKNHRDLDVFQEEVSNVQILSNIATLWLLGYFKEIFLFTVVDIKWGEAQVGCVVSISITSSYLSGRPDTEG